MTTGRIRSRRGGPAFALSRLFYRMLFPFFERLGLHITPVHFYQPIPNTRKLDNGLWDRQSELVGIDMQDEKQLLLLSTLADKYKPEYDQLPRTEEETSEPYQYYLRNPSLGPLDGAVLYAMIRHFAPKKVIDIGAGFTTCLAAQAIRQKGNGGELVAIDPHLPTEWKRGFPGLTRPLTQPVQTVPLEEFQALNKNDMLLIDSSHVLKIGSDVWYEYLEILPRLQNGVLIHIHDIFLPMEYPFEWVRREYRFCNEQYLLQAFLAFNRSFEVLWAGSYMALKYPDALAAAFPLFTEGDSWPGGFWIRRTKEK